MRQVTTHWYIEGRYPDDYPEETLRGSWAYFAQSDAVGTQLAGLKLKLALDGIPVTEFRLLRVTETRETETTPL